MQAPATYTASSAIPGHPGGMYLYMCLACMSRYELMFQKGGNPASAGPDATPGSRRRHERSDGSQARRSLGIPAYALEFQNLAVPKVGNVWHDGSLGIPGHYVHALPTTRGGNMGTPRPIHVPASRSTMALGLRHTRQQDVGGAWRRPITRNHAGP